MNKLSFLTNPLGLAFASYMTLVFSTICVLFLPESLVSESVGGYIVLGLLFLCIFGSVDVYKKITSELPNKRFILIYSICMIGFLNVTSALIHPPYLEEARQIVTHSSIPLAIMLMSAFFAVQVGLVYTMITKIVKVQREQSMRKASL